jgi:hypothetical protein
LPPLLVRSKKKKSNTCAKNKKTTNDTELIKVLFFRKLINNDFIKYFARQKKKTELREQRE